MARLLAVPKGDITTCASRCDRLYRSKIIRKPGKKPRQVFDSREPLKQIQSQIVTKIFREVEYPPYLMGGLPDGRYKRGYLQNATSHAGTQIFISEDVSNFFPSIPKAYVAAVFRLLFRFPPDIADLLATLCTRRGFVPQGAPTSTDIANLLLFRHEARVEYQLRAMGFHYSRFVDDLNASSRTPRARAEVNRAIGLMTGLISRYGLKINRKKEQVASRGSRRHAHNLNLEGQVPTISADERKNIRTAVHQFERLVRANDSRLCLRTALQSVSARVARLKGLHPGEYRRLHARVSAAAEASAMKNSQV